MPAKSENGVAGIGLMVLGMGMFTLNDALGKLLVADYTVPQVLALRSAAAFAILLPLVLRRGVGRVFQVPRPGRHALRLVLVVAEVALFYLSVRHRTLADVMIIYQAAPIFVTVLSIPLLGERVGAPRWAAVLVGFAGVFIVLQPGGGTFGASALTALAGSLAFAVIMILTRTLRATDGLSMVFFQILAVGLAGLAALPFAWAPLARPWDVALLGLLGVVAMIAYFLVNAAMAAAPAALTAPFQYVSIPLAMILGWLIWGDVPGARSLTGCAIIIGAGLFILYRERRGAAAG